MAFLRRIVVSLILVWIALLEVSSSLGVDQSEKSSKFQEAGVVKNADGAKKASKAAAQSKNGELANANDRKEVAKPAGIDTADATGRSDNVVPNKKVEAVVSISGDLGKPGEHRVAGEAKSKNSKAEEIAGRLPPNAIPSEVDKSKDRENPGVPEFPVVVSVDEDPADRGLDPSPVSDLKVDPTEEGNGHDNQIEGNKQNGAGVGGKDLISKGSSVAKADILPPPANVNNRKEVVKPVGTNTADATGRRNNDVPDKKVKAGDHHRTAGEAKSGNDKTQEAKGRLPANVTPFEADKSHDIIPAKGNENPPDAVVIPEFPDVVYVDEDLADPNLANDLKFDPRTPPFVDFNSEDSTEEGGDHDKQIEGNKQSGADVGGKDTISKGSSVAKVNIPPGGNMAQKDSATVLTVKNNEISPQKGGIVVQKDSAAIVAVKDNEISPQREWVRQRPRRPFDNAHSMKVVLMVIVVLVVVFLCTIYRTRSSFGLEAQYLSPEDALADSGLGNDEFTDVLSLEEHEVSKFLDNVLKKHKLPRHDLQKYSRILSENYLTTIEQIKSMDDGDWNRCDLPVEIVSLLRQELNVSANMKRRRENDLEREKSDQALIPVVSIDIE